MAQTIEVKLVDDIDGSNADETLAFGLDGKSYEIELSRETPRLYVGARTLHRQRSSSGAKPPALVELGALAVEESRAGTKTLFSRAQYRGEGRLPSLGKHANGQAYW